MNKFKNTEGPPPPTLPNVEARRTRPDGGGVEEGGGGGEGEEEGVVVVLEKLDHVPVQEVDHLQQPDHIGSHRNSVSINLGPEKTASSKTNKIIINSF